MKKLAILLVFAMMLTSVSAFAADYPSTVHLDGTLPILDAGTDFYTFEIITPTPENRVIAANDLDQVRIMKEATGLDLNWTGIPEAGFGEKVNLMLASNDLPDMIWRGIDQSVISQYLDDELFVPTEDLIDQYAPNIKAMLEAHPEYKALATYPDGHMYGFPYVEEMFGLTMTNGPILINQTWLDKLGLEMPKTWMSSRLSDRLPRWRRSERQRRSGRNPLRLQLPG